MPLLRLVHALERRRLVGGRSFQLGLSVRRPVGTGTAPLIASATVHGQGPRAVVVGTGDRVDVAVGGNASPLPGGMSSQSGDGILPRHLAIVVLPLPSGTLLRVISLHPERGFAVLPPPESGAIPSVDVIERLDTPSGAVVAWNSVRIAFGGLVLDVEAVGAGAGDVVEVLAVGEQLAFHAGPGLRAVGSAVASIAGPALDGAGGGGHAIPALVASDEDAVTGALVLRARADIYRVDVSVTDLLRGVLIGRSRRCMIGRGFDENDGLSRVHALVVGLDEPGAGGVFAFDLASRYGLRDVSRPSRLIPMARLDDGIGCLVYGAGYLTWEMS